MNLKKLVIAGGSGQIGRMLERYFETQGATIVNLTRSVRADSDVYWDGETVADWATHLEGADALINLAGRTVNCRYTAENKRQIMESRVKSTCALGTAIQACAKPPKVWLQSSTATIYDDRYDAANDEQTGIINDRKTGKYAHWNFSIEVAKAWESAAESFALPETRLVLLRSAMVMSPDAGGIFDTLVTLTRRWLGGKSGHGRQYVSWIHEHDFVRALDFLMRQESISGAVNLCSPQPLPNAEFMRVLREGLGVAVGLPATEWMLEVGALLMRTETELLLKSRRVVPKRLLDAGFQFRYPEWPDAARELVSRLPRGTR